MAKQYGLGLNMTNPIIFWTSQVICSSFIFVVLSNGSVLLNFSYILQGYYTAIKAIIRDCQTALKVLVNAWH